MGMSSTWVALLTALAAACAPGLVRAQSLAQPATAMADDAPVEDEPALLAQLREAEREHDPPALTVADGAARAGTTLPEGLEPEFARQLDLPALTTRITPRLARTLVLYRTDRRARRALASWVRHAARYRARLEAILESEGVPRDLVWVVAAESGFDPHDVSPAGAVGLWQLMPDAARTYGLRVDAWVDERRDPERATRAAARYLRDLYARFRAWDLALAAYNMGYNALLRAIRRFNTNDFETLAALEAGLPWETVHYVPRILTAAIAARNATHFDLASVATDPPLTWEDARLARSVPLEALARALDIPAEQLRALNPALLAARTPPADTARPFVLHVPIGLRARTELAAVQLALPPTRRYVTRHGETLAEVAARYGLDVPRLLALSGLASEQRVVAGTEILVPDRAPAEPPVVERPLVAVEEPPGGAPPGRRRVFYRVVPGDELSSVARALGVRREDLVAWNALDEEARLQSGMWLQAYLAGEPPAARVWEASQVDVLRRGSEEFHARVVAHDGRVRIRVTVGEGDTMERVAARYGLTVGSLARINHRSRHAALHPGEELIVYTTPERLPPAPTAGDARDAHDAAGEARAAGEGDVTPAQSAAAGQTASP